MFIVSHLACSIKNKLTKHVLHSRIHPITTMTAHEGIPHNFKDGITYKDPSLAPMQVASSTARLMDLYFTPLLTDRVPAKEYFANATLDFVWKAEKGFYRNLDKIDRTGKISAIDRERLMMLASQQGEGVDIEEDEAFGFSLVTFVHMPHMASHRFLPKGFSQRGIMAPPFTTREFFLRLRELRRVVTGIASGQTTPSTPLEVDKGLWRTYWFFQVAKDIPMHVKEEPQHTQEEAEKFLANLLKDVDISL